jgi:hypothetical protein
MSHFSEGKANSLAVFGQPVRDLPQGYHPTFLILSLSTSLDSRLHYLSIFADMLPHLFWQLQFVSASFQVRHAPVKLCCPFVCSLLLQISLGRYDAHLCLQPSIQFGAEFVIGHFGILARHSDSGTKAQRRPPYYFSKHRCQQTIYNPYPGSGLAVVFCSLQRPSGQYSI